ncbi:SDR family NAD(P)-dependent oxidoreductase [Porticoccus sp.]|nr:MAG: SDR family oxidoreductase [Gammaproteobacteria bacterium]
MQIKDKVAVITGAASGIGQAVSTLLAERGVKKIAVVDMTDRIDAVAADINAQAGRDFAVPFQGNVTDAEFRQSVYDQMEKDHGVVSICVPAAGITRDDLAVRVNKETGKASIYPQENFEMVVNVNLIAPVYWAMELIARVAEHRAANGLKKWAADEGVQGNVVFIGSISSQGNKGQVSYASTKAGLEGAASTLAKEATFHGVRCGVIHPGFTDTPMVRAMGDDYIEKYILPFTQLGRLIKPEEIADAICFMISNSVVSGELWADAGWHPSA